MRLTFKQKVVCIVLSLSLALFCWPIKEAKAQTNARYYLLLSDQNRNLGNYYIILHMMLQNYGFSDTYGYKTAALQYFQNAYAYAQTATQYALQDYNNNVQGTYYKAYMEYSTANAMQNYWATGLNYISLADQSSGETSYNYAKAATDNIYYAITKYGPGIFWAGCEP